MSSQAEVRPSKRSQRRSDSRSTATDRGVAKIAAASHLPTFFGIGAQKAGTTWLYQLLATYSDCAPLPVKEMHFFDAKYMPGRNPFGGVEKDFERLALHAQRLSKLVSERLDDESGRVELYQDGFLDGVGLDVRIDKLVKLAERLKVRDTASYVQYMENWRARAGGKLVGEITPAYSILPDAAFREILSLYPEARIIFIMRDPIERIWSQIRFFISMRGRQDEPNSMVAKLVRRDDFLLRSDYRRTIEALERVIPISQIHYCFFENLVASGTVVDEVRKLESFLGLSALGTSTISQFAEKPANVSPRNRLSEENRLLLRDVLSDTYEFVRKRYDHVPQSWSL
jgi:hypothetical protein